MGRLGSATGASAAIEAGRERPRVGRWVAHGQRFLIELDTPDAVPAGLGRVRVNLPTGMHAFMAWLQPRGDRRVEVLPHHVVDVQERRAAVRVPVDLAGTLGSPGGAWIAAVRVRDLSVTGAGLAGAGPVPPGTRCVLRVDGDWGTRLGPLFGDLVWCQPDGPEGFRYGMRFVGRPDLTDQIYAWLSALRKTMAGPAGGHAKGGSAAGEGCPAGAAQDAAPGGRLQARP